MMKRFALLSVLTVTFVLSGVLNTATAQNPRPKPCGSCFVFDNISCKDLFDVPVSLEESYCPPNECFIEGSCQLPSDTKWKAVGNVYVVLARKRPALEGETGRFMSPEHPEMCFLRTSCDDCQWNPTSQKLECLVDKDFFYMEQGSFCNGTVTCPGGEGGTGGGGTGGGGTGGGGTGGGGTDGVVN
jgi:hypothetical protein